MLGLARISAAARRLWLDRRGNFAMMAGLTMPVLLLGAGYGVNVAQIALTRSNLVAALDAAVTSTARDLTTGAIAEKDAPQVVQAFLVANGLRAYAEEGRVHLDNLVIDRTVGTITARASVEIDVAFALFGTANKQRITTEASAIYSDRHIDVAMVLDITGSMGGPKIKDLRTAAGAAVDQLLGGNINGSDRVRIAIVPYSDSVNVGTQLAHTVYVESDEYSPVVAPKVTLVSNTGSTCATEREGTNQFTDVGPEVQRVNRDYRLGSCPNPELMPLTASASALKSRISAFTANGLTAGQIGIQWGWYLLSPKWSGVLPASAQPHPYGDKKFAKYAILMTDGDFNTAYANVPKSHVLQQQGDKARTYAEKLCTEMKKVGIEIFSVGFDLGKGWSSAKAILSKCASPDTGGIKHYYEASTGQELISTFKAIAGNIERLALTK